MQVVIIAGGEGKRMKPLTTHKSLLPLFGNPLVSYLMNDIGTQKHTFIVVTSPSSLSDFEHALEDRNITFATQKEPQGMADALRSAENILDRNDSLLVVSAAKLLSKSAYSAVLDKVAKNPREAAVAAYKTTKYKEGGYLVMEGDRVKGVVEKPGEDKMPSPYYKLVLDYFPQAGDVLNSLKEVHSDNDDEYEIAVTKYAGKFPVHKIEIDSVHVSLKHAHHILDAMRMAFDLHLRPCIHPTAHIAKSAVIEGNVQIDEGAKVYDYAVIKGPTYIGRNAVIGNGALVRESSIEEGCQVGFGSEIARSYLGPRTKGHMMYVGDSIIEGDVNLSAGTVLANYRFDHKSVIASMLVGKVETGKKKFGSIIAKDTITGVNTSLMPGTVVGSHVTIGSGCVVKGLVPDGSVIQPTFSFPEVVQHD